jgi:hypothetical protein
MVFIVPVDFSTEYTSSLEDGSPITLRISSTLSVALQDSHQYPNSNVTDLGVIVVEGEPEQQRPKEQNLFREPQRETRLSSMKNLALNLNFVALLARGKSILSVANAG